MRPASILAVITFLSMPTCAEPPPDNAENQKDEAVRKLEYEFHLKHVDEMKSAQHQALADIPPPGDRSLQSAPARSHNITLEDYFSIAYITTCAISTDGARIAYIDSRWEPPAESRNSDLWVADNPEPGKNYTTADAQSGRVGFRHTRRLTFDPASEASPQWSPDSRVIYFTANYRRPGDSAPPWNGKTQVWRISVDGGEPQAVTRVADGVGWYYLSKDGATLYYSVTHEVVAGEFKDLKTKFKQIEYGHGVDHFSQIWKLDLVTWREEKLIDDKRVIHDAAVSPDESRIAMLTTPTEPLISNEGQSRVDVWDARAKKVTALPDKLWRADAPSPYGWLEGLAWSADSKALAFTVAFDGYPTELFVAEWTSSDPLITSLSRPPDAYVMSPLAWRGATRDLCFLGDRRAVTHLYRIADVRGGRQGPPDQLTDDSLVITGFSLNRNGARGALVAGTTRTAPEVYPLAMDLPSAATKSSAAAMPLPLTNANPQMSEWKLPQLSKVTWKGARGDEVEGILELPPDYRPGRKLPMIVEIHGGPTASTPYCLNVAIYGRTFLPAQGYAVFSANYRGSTGYGDKFLTDLVGHENDIEVEDILKGVDAMIDRGIADPNQLGVIGWSNGGFLVNCLISRTTRFKAASSGAGVIDQLMQWGTEDTPGHVNNYMQGFPWQQRAAYEKASPASFLDKIKTPTLIHVGAADSRVPAVHARTLYRALHEYLHVPTELLVYPGEPHGLMKYKDRKAKMEWDLAWFDRYVRNKPAVASKNADKN